MSAPGIQKEKKLLQGKGKNRRRRFDLGSKDTEDYGG